MQNSAPTSRAERLSEWIIASNQSANLLSIKHRAPDNWPNWYAQLLTGLSVIDKAAPITYLSSTISHDESARGTLFALTGELVIQAAATELAPTGQQEMKIALWSRATLEEIRIMQAADYSVFEVDEANALPQFLRFELHYSGRPALTLPLSDRPGDQAEKDMAALYARLLQDLAA